MRGETRFTTASAFRSPTNVIAIGIHTHTLLQPLPFARPRTSANDILRIENILRTERFGTCTNIIQNLVNNDIQTTSWEFREASS